jgi:hypothetical protein
MKDFQSFVQKLSAQVKEAAVQGCTGRWPPTASATSKMKTASVLLTESGTITFPAQKKTCSELKRNTPVYALLKTDKSTNCRVNVRIHKGKAVIEDVFAE